jgi:hypothetical protein
MDIEDNIFVDKMVKDVLTSIDSLVDAQRDLALPWNHNVQVLELCHGIIVEQTRMIHYLNKILDSIRSNKVPYNVVERREEMMKD